MFTLAVLLFHFTLRLPLIRLYFKYETVLIPKVTYMLCLTASHTRVARAKQAYCLLHWLSVFTLAVLLFHFTLRLPLIRLYFKYETVLIPKVTYMLCLTASHTRVARAKQAYCLLHWLSVFKLTVLLFHFTPRLPLIRLYFKYETVLIPKVTYVL